jgi:UDP-glucuronate decarboxylase
VHYQSDPYATLTTSVLGALRLVEMARGRRCLIVHTSTSEVYGDPAVHPQTEYWGNVNPIGERACYDEGKRCAETMFMDARRAWGIDVRIARVFNTYGPRMAIGDGRVVSSFITQAIRGSAAHDLRRGPADPVVCYVDDLIDGLLAMVRPASIDGPITWGTLGSSRWPSWRRRWRRLWAASFPLKKLRSRPMIRASGSPTSRGRASSLGSSRRSIFGRASR